MKAKLYVCAYDKSTDKAGAVEVSPDSPLLQWDMQELILTNSKLPQGFNLFFITSINEPTKATVIKISKEWDRKLQSLPQGN